MSKRERYRSRILRDIAQTLGIGLFGPRAARAMAGHARGVIGADSATVFLLDGDHLHGAYGVWDWTRTSFAVPVDQWPNIRDAMSSGDSVHVNESNALGLELDWFEKQGITGCLCTPLRVGSKALGVIFWDFVAGSGPLSKPDCNFAQSVATILATAIGVRAPVNP